MARAGGVWAHPQGIHSLFRDLVTTAFALSRNKSAMAGDAIRVGVSGCRSRTVSSKPWIAGRPAAMVVGATSESLESTTGADRARRPQSARDGGQCRIARVPRAENAVARKVDVVPAPHPAVAVGHRGLRVGAHTVGAHEVQAVAERSQRRGRARPRVPDMVGDLIGAVERPSDPP